MSIKIITEAAVFKCPTEKLFSRLQMSYRKTVLETSNVLQKDCSREFRKINRKNILKFNLTLSTKILKNGLTFFKIFVM